jgi:hypothetical protein
MLKLAAERYNPSKSPREPLCIAIEPERPPYFAIPNPPNEYAGSLPRPFPHAPKQALTALVPPVVDVQSFCSYSHTLQRNPNHHPEPHFGQVPDLLIQSQMGFLSTGPRDPKRIAFLVYFLTHIHKTPSTLRGTNKRNYAKPANQTRLPSTENTGTAPAAGSDHTEARTNN